MHTQRASYVPALVVAGLTALLAVACGGQYNESNPTAATALTAGRSAAALGGAGLGGGAISFGLKADKVDVCHVTGNGFNVISVSNNALPAHQGHGDLVVGVDADQNCEPLGGGDNTPPVALDGPVFFGETWVPIDQNFQPIDEDGNEVDSGSLLASDADGDTLTFGLVPGSFNPEGNDVNETDLSLNSATGEWSITGFCIGLTGGYSSFQWTANDGQADSNIATQYFSCAV